MESKQRIVESLSVPPHLRADSAFPTTTLAQTVSLDLDSFCRDYVPTLCTTDLVIFIASQEAGLLEGSKNFCDGIAALRIAQEAGASVRHILVLADDATTAVADAFISANDLLAAVIPIAPLGVIVRLPALYLRLPSAVATTDELSSSPQTVRTIKPSDLPPSHLAEIAMKLVLNAVTTGAHIKRGVIFSNKMINVGITNQKLFHRAVGIVQAVSGATMSDSLRGVLRAIYHRDFCPSEVGPDYDAFIAKAASEHVQAAALQSDLVPVAILLASATVALPPAEIKEQQAIAFLKSEPILRRAIAAAIKGASPTSFS
jgi:hypothetical protein